MSQASTMNAITYASYGQTDVLAYSQLDRPEPSAGQVLIQVKAAGVNPAEWHFMTGSPLPARAMVGLFKPKTGRLGLDVAGVVAALGEGVTTHAIGDEVYGACRGSYAEYVTVKADLVNPLPDSLSMEQGGGVAIAAVTALQGLRDKADLQPGDHVLINGASGGVGTFAVQIAKLMGAQVTGVCSTRNVELVRSLGADHVVDYTTDDFTEGSVRYDAILDNVGSHSFKEYTKVMSPDAVVVMVGGPKVGFGKMMASMVKNFFQAMRSTQSAAMFVADENPTDLGVLHEWLDTAKLTTAIDRTYPLAQAGKALDYLSTQRARGKVVLIP